MMIEVLIAALAVMLVSLLGIIFVQKTANDFLEKRLSFLVSFSAGVFLVTAGALALEVFEIVPQLWQGVLLIAAGYILAWLLHRALPGIHNHDTHDGHQTGTASKLIIGDAIHNVADGIVLVTAFAASSAIGLAVTLSILIHEGLQEVSKFFILRHAGYSVKKALLVNFLVSSTVLVGVLIGHLAIASHELEALLLSLSAGFFLHVVLHDLFPKRSSHEKGTVFLLHVALVIVGAFAMGIIAGLLGESH